MRPSRIALLLSIAAVPALAAAQSAAVPDAFPAGAEPVSADRLRALVSGRVFNVKPAVDPAWRLDYKESGYVFLNTASGFADSGRWHTEEAKLCGTGWQRVPSGCGEVRAVGDRLYLKRASNGEVVALVPE